MHATAEHVRHEQARLKQAQQRLRAQHSTATILNAIAAAAQSWLAPESPWRARAREQAPQLSGFSVEMVEEAIDLTFGALTARALTELLERELGDARILDQFCPRGAVQARAHGPALLTHILAGNVPMPGLVSICCGLLLKAGNLVKAARRDPVFPLLFVESLRAVDPILADCVAVLDWERTETAVTQAAVTDAEAVIAYGDDRTITTLRQMVPAHTAFLGYGHKISFAYLAKEAMTEQSLPELVAGATFDVAVYDQQGCLSPHVIYVEERGQFGPRKFAAALAGAMAQYQLRVPRGTLSATEAASLMQLRQAYEFRSASDKRVAVWASPRPNDWTVIYEDDPSFTPSCLNRVVFVKPMSNFTRAVDSIRPYAEQISTVGVAPLGPETAGLADALAGLGIHRVCRIGQMQRPALSWPHDGRPNLATLVRWTDWG